MAGAAEARTEGAAADSVPVLSPDDLAERLEEEAEEGGELVAVFFAHWCPFCQAFLPTLDEVEAPAGVALVQVDVTDPEDAGWDDYAVETIPTAVRYEGGTEVDRVEAVPGEGLEPEAFRAFLDGQG